MQRFSQPVRAQSLCNRFNPSVKAQPCGGHTHLRLTCDDRALVVITETAALVILVILVIEIAGMAHAI